MPTRLLTGTDDDGTPEPTVMYDSVTMWAFGPVFRTRGDAHNFIMWLPGDPRDYAPIDLERMYGQWLGQQSLRTRDSSPLPSSSSSSPQPTPHSPHGSAPSSTDYSTSEWTGNEDPHFCDEICADNPGSCPAYKRMVGYPGYTK